MLRSRDEVLDAAGLWSEERSPRECVGQVGWRLAGDFGALSPPQLNQYFAEGIVRASGDEVFVDWATVRECC